jgi:hypothetical protein
VFLAVVFGSSKHVRVTSAGTFFCLYCKGDRGYELREWRQTPHVFLVPLSTSGGRFVLCSDCQTAFDPECLDDSSTAEGHELEVDVPGFACKVLRRRPADELRQYLGQDSLGQDSLDRDAARPARTVATAPIAQTVAGGQGQRRAASARSGPRRH